jgi:hypothetical protein
MRMIPAPVMDTDAPPTPRDATTAPNEKPSPGKNQRKNETIYNKIALTTIVANDR